MIRPLSSADAEAFARLRVRALETDPHAFESSPETDFSREPGLVRERLDAGEKSGDARVWGAFASESPASKLLGSLGLTRSANPKLRHKAMVWGVWVAPEARGRGLGRGLLDTALAHARGLPDLERVLLGVSPRSEAAHRLYETAGFRRYATEPRALRIGDAFLDEHLLALELGPERP